MVVLSIRRDEQEPADQDEAQDNPPTLPPAG
jgi:hypothetical protein